MSPPSKNRTDRPPKRPGIKHVTHFFPEDALDNDMLRARFEYEPGFIENKLGIERRYHARRGDATSDMCATAVRSLLAESGERAEAIEALIVVTLNPDFIMPHTAALVQDKCGLSATTATFDVALGCSGYVYGLNLAESLMRANGFSKVILVTAVNFSRILEPTSRNTLTLFGDAATATLLCDENPRYYLGKSTFGTDGSMREAIVVHGSGTADDGDGMLEMDGRAVFNFMMTRVPPDIRRCLEINDLTIDDVPTWVFHQASSFMIRNLVQRLGIPEQRVVYDLEDGGNTSSCSIPVTLSRRILNQPDLPPIIGISGFGVGASWASNFLFKNPNED